MAHDEDTLFDQALDYRDSRPAWVPLTWGLTVACGERRHEACSGTRKWQTFITGEWRDAGPCTCPCHEVAARLGATVVRSHPHHPCADLDCKVCR